MKKLRKLKLDKKMVSQLNNSEMNFLKGGSDTVCPTVAAVATCTIKVTACQIEFTTPAPVTTPKVPFFSMESSLF